MGILKWKSWFLFNIYEKENTFERYVHFVEINFGKNEGVSNDENVKEGEDVPVSEHHAMNAYGGSRYKAPHIHNLLTGLKWAVTITLRPLYPRCYPSGRRLDELQWRSRHGGQKNIFCPCRVSNPSRPARNRSLY
jgi:hypothetical protein